jgi:PAS domain S-box-containing protein
VSGRLGRRFGRLRLRPYAAALGAIALAILARRLGDPRLGAEQLPYGSVLVAAMIVVWFAGLRPALIVVYAGGIAANFFLVAPRMSFTPGADHQSWGLLAFMVLGTAISMFGGFVHLQRARAEAAAATLRYTEAALREAHDGLDRRVRERTAELARSNESLRASEERFRLLVEGVRGYALLMFNASGAIVGWNGGAERLFERSTDVVGDSIAALIPGLQGAALAEAVRRGTGELEAVRPGDRVFPIELAITRLEPQGVLVGIVRDISERKRLEAVTQDEQRRADELRRKTEELEADNRRMHESARLHSQFLSSMSHELRTPLNAIIGFSELMHRGAAGPIADQHREFLGDILTSSRQLLQLINNMLDLAKLESGTLEVAPQPVELTPVIGEVHDMLRGMAAGRHVAIELELAADLGSVTVDPAKLRQILYHYVSNALKFTSQGGRVTIRAALIDQMFRVEVEDTGIGIAPEDLRCLFIAFRQLDASATKRYPGPGVGLALTKRLAEAHGGTVGVRSVRGVGSTFWVELPRQTVPRPGLRIAIPTRGTLKALE